MTPAEKAELARKRAEKKKQREEMAKTGLVVFDKGYQAANNYAIDKINAAVDKYGLERFGFKKGEHIGSIFDMKKKGKGSRAPAGPSDGRRARAAIVKQVMAEQGLSMPEASKYVKDNGLY